MTEELQYRRDGHVATFTLNRPDRRNAFSERMIAEWVAAIEEARRDDAIRVVVVTGAGSAFCAGGDLGELYHGWRSADPITRKNYLWQGIHRVPFALADLDKPVIGAINGAATGAGLDMALMCDIRLASEKAVLAESYVLIGLAPGDGGAFFLPRLVGLAKACELLFTGEPISAAEAERIGLVNRLVPHDELMKETYAMAEKIASRPPTAVRLTKRLVYQGLESNLKTALDTASSFVSHLMSLDETGTAMAAMLERLAAGRQKGKQA